jgi:patatin-related protein
MATPDIPNVNSGVELPAESTEHRLALIMNGGVSLAVWMGGVAFEIDNARRASNGIPVHAAATEEEIAVHDLWVKATRRLGVRVTVDVIAGTSAGGLNGVLLAAAIARGASLAGLKNLWLTSGQMSPDALLKPQVDGVLSLLNGGFFHDEITGALHTMMPTAHGRDVSLVVTSTALGQSSRQAQDSGGRRFNEADHRRRFRFSRHGSRPRYVKRPGGYELSDQDPVNHFAQDEPLATAARASASYPAAFAPVRETSLLRNRRVWPDWPTGANRDWLADGGILDNSPFDPVLESIEARPVSGQWKRTLCYIIPDGDDGALGRDITPPAAPVDDETADGTPEPPPPWTSVVAAALGFPREANFRDDIQHLHDSIRGGRSSFDVSRFQQLTEAAPETGSAPALPPPAELLATARTICTAAIALYRQSCTAAAIYQARDAIVNSRANGYLNPGAEVSAPLLDPAQHRWLPDAFPVQGAGLPTAWEWGADAADRIVRVMLRALSRVPDRGPLRQAISGELQQITAIRQAVDKYLAEAGKDSSLADEKIVGLLDDTYAALRVDYALAPIVGRTVVLYAEMHLGNQAKAPDVLAAVLAIEVSNGSGSVPSGRPRPIFQFDRLGLDEPPPLLKQEYDRQLPGPAGAASTAASRSNDILYGTRLSHFAAFGDPDWRAWDWMWGRMNALTHLASILGLSDDEVNELTTAVLNAEGRQLLEVQSGIGRVLNASTKELLDELRAKDRIPPVLDSLFDLARSKAPTLPSLPPAVMTLGQIASDLLARHPDNVDHHLVRDAATLPRHLLWKRVEPDN